MGEINNRTDGNVPENYKIIKNCCSWSEEINMWADIFEKAISMLIIDTNVLHK